MFLQDKIIQYGFALALTLLLFCYARWGDFSWLTLTGPVTLEANVENMEEASYIASPALQAVFIRFFFLIVFCFFCMIPNLVKGLRQHAYYLACLPGVVYVFFSYLLGAWTFFLPHRLGSSQLRMASIICITILLIVCYDTENRKFTLPGLLLQPSFTGPLICIFSALCLVNAMILQKISWLLNEHLYFVLLRIGVFLTALTGALAFHAWKRGV